MLRLDKYLADMSIGTRTEVKKAIRKGLVQVDGIVVKDPQTKVDSQQQVTCQGTEVGYAAFEYYMLHKPAGIVSATRDKKAQTVLELIDTKKRKDLFPVGRLDKDTEGLLLITNDGDMAHRLLSPKKHIDKVYYAKIKGCVTESEAALFSQGIDIGEVHPTKPAQLLILESGEISIIKLIIQEGRYHQVKRMFEAVGKEVLYLKRLSMGTLELDSSLAPGEYRSLTKEEVSRLC